MHGSICPECAGELKYWHHGLWRCTRCGNHFEAPEPEDNGCCGQDFEDRDLEFDYGKPFPEEVC